MGWGATGSGAFLCITVVKGAWAGETGVRGGEQRELQEEGER